MARSLLFGRIYHPQHHLCFKYQLHIALGRNNDSHLWTEGLKGQAFDSYHAPIRAPMAPSAGARMLAPARLNLRLAHRLPRLLWYGPFPSDRHIRHLCGGNSGSPYRRGQRHDNSRILKWEFSLVL